MSGLVSVIADTAAPLRRFHAKLYGLAGLTPQDEPVCLVITLGALLRFAIVVVGDALDALGFTVKYTDVDYMVYTDAARAMVSTPDHSPFHRATYRYTPLLALVLIPNLVLPAWGKLLFVCVDTWLCILLARLLTQRSDGVSPRTVALSVSCFALNPMCVNISTRGNADSLVSLAVVGSVLALHKGAWTSAGLWMGAAVHVKLYPVIYGWPVLLAATDGLPAMVTVEGWRAALPKLLRFFGAAGALVAVLTAACYASFGWTGLYEAYLYHFVRLDHRHNFSVYFLDIVYGPDGASRFATGIQLGLGMLVSYMYASDLPAAMFLQTCVLTAASCVARSGQHADLCRWIFVAFNKVITAQYFHWVFALMPLVVPSSTASLPAAGGMFLFWLVMELGWSIPAGLLEIVGGSVHFAVLVGSGLFLVTNTVCMCAFMLQYQPSAFNAAIVKHKLS